MLDGCEDIQPLRTNSLKCSRRTMLCLVWGHVFSAYLDTEGEVCRRSVQLTAVHHSVHVQIVQMSHTIKVSRLLVQEKHKVFKDSSGQRLKTKINSCSCVLVTFWPWRSLWRSSRVRSAAGRSRPSSRPYGSALSDAGSPESPDTSQTSAGSEEQRDYYF